VPALQSPYDVFGNLTQAIPTSGITYNYIMDGQNRRVARSISGTVNRRYLYQDKLRIAAQLSATGVMQKEFIYAVGSQTPDYMITGSGKYRLISNHLGSPRLVVDASNGTIMQRIDYDALGSVTTDTNADFQPFGFAGGLYDQHTKLVRFGARDYDAETGRWTTKDPILFAGGDTNLYGYVLNDPVNWIDPSGLRGGVADTPIDDATVGGGGRDIGVGFSGAVIPIGMACDMTDGRGRGQDYGNDGSKNSEYNHSSEHTKNKSKSKEEKHQQGRRRDGMDKGKEKGDERRKRHK
jgi:RHS repeat-associated protein